MTVSSEMWWQLFPLGAALGLLGSMLTLRLLGQAMGRRGWVFVLAAAVAGGAAAPVVVMAASTDNTNAPTPAALSILALAGPVVVVAGYSAAGSRRWRFAGAVAGVLIVSVGQFVVAVDAYSCVDDDCFDLPVALRPMPFVTSWLAALALWFSVAVGRPRLWDRRGRRVGLWIAAALAGVALTLALWPLGVTGSYTIERPDRTDAFLTLELNRCGMPIVDAFGHDDFASTELPGDPVRSWASVHCRPAAERRLLSATAVLVLALAAAALAGLADRPTAHRGGGESSSQSRSTR